MIAEIEKAHIECLEVAENNTYGRFAIEPLERGFGHTLGNALRRVLLNSLPGAAVTSIRIDGVQHEFSTVPGVKEDVTEIILNFKELSVRMFTDQPKQLELNMEGPCEVTAADIKADDEVEIINPDLHIATLSGDASLSIEMKVADGRGYVIADDLRDPDAPLGTIFLDANFSPVTKVAFHVSDTRVGQHTDFNRLELEVWTDGSITPEDAMAYAAKLLVDHF